MSTVWYPQVDLGLYNYIASNITVDDKPVKVLFRKPDQDFYKEEYPCVSIYGLFETLNRKRLYPDDVIKSRDYTAHTVRMEKSCLTYDLYYQIDFWSDYIEDMYKMTSQWDLAIRDAFALPVVDTDSIDREVIVVPVEKTTRADTLREGERFWHSYRRCLAYAWLDDTRGKDVPMVQYPKVNKVNLGDI